MRWANRGGWTTEIVAVPHADDWQWRLSVADVASDGPFSRFPGVARTIALLSGNGFALSVDGAPEQVIDRSFEPFHFDGSAETDCRLIDGPVQDVNLMVRRGSVDLSFSFITVPPGAAVSVDAEVVVVVAGSITAGGRRLDLLDAVRSTEGSLSIVALDDQQAVVAVIQFPRRANAE